MKYLKKYNESKNDLNQLIIDIKDLFVEAQDIDDRYHILFQDPNSSLYTYDKYTYDNIIGTKKKIGDIDFKIHKLKKTGQTLLSVPFNTNEIKDVLDRIIQFMDNYNFKYRMAGAYYNSDKIDVKSNSEEIIRVLQVKFRKN